MKHRTTLLALLMALLPGVAYAQAPEWMTKNRQMFFYGMIAFGGLAVLMIIWEVIYQVTSKNSANSSSSINIVDNYGGSRSNEDPIKSLLADQSRGAASENESELPDFLQDNNQDEGPGLLSAPDSGGAESHNEDPFQKLLKRSGKEGPSSQPQRQSPPIHPRHTRGDSSGAEGDSDPFKQLLRSSKDAVRSTGDQGGGQQGGPPGLAIKQPPSQRQPEPPPIRHSEEVETLSEPSLSQGPPRQQPPRQQPPRQQPPRQQPPRMKFKKPGNAQKSKGADRLFDRLSDNQESSGSPTLRQPLESQKPPAPAKKSLSLDLPQKGGRSKSPPIKPSGKPPQDPGKRPRKLELKFKPKK